MPVLESSWMPLERLRFAPVSAQLANWLADRGSLTQRLIEGCDGSFGVRVKRQGWHQPLYSESRLLGMRAGESALVREVELLCDRNAVVFARTLIPVGSLKGEASAHSVMMLVGWGDCSIDSAAENGNIKLVKNVDYDLFSIFIFYQRFTTVVYGEADIPKAQPRGQ